MQTPLPSQFFALKRFFVFESLKNEKKKRNETKTKQLPSEWSWSDGWCTCAECRRWRCWCASNGGLDLLERERDIDELAATNREVAKVDWFIASRIVERLGPQHVDWDFGVADRVRRFEDRAGPCRHVRLPTGPLVEIVAAVERNACPGVDVERIGVHVSLQDTLLDHKHSVAEIASSV